MKKTVAMEEAAMMEVTKGAVVREVMKEAAVKEVPTKFWSSQYKILS